LRAHVPGAGVARSNHLPMIARNNEGLSDAGLNAILIDWSFGDDDPQTHAKARKLVERVRSRYARIPVF
jgi:hypothetical protein